MLGGRSQVQHTHGLKIVAQGNSKVGPKRRVRPVEAVAEPSPSVPFSSTSDHLEEWSADSWRNFVALQQPTYPDKVRVEKMGCVMCGVVHG